MGDQVSRLAALRLAPAAQRLEAVAGRGLRTLRTQPAVYWIAIAEASAAVVLAAFSAQLVWAIAKPPEWPQTVTASKPVAAARHDWQGSVLTSFNPFHRGQVEHTATAAARAPETMLNLQLFGIRAGNGSNAGSAIVAGSDNIQNVYFVGQDIMPGVRLEGVAPGHVVIRRNGVAESLSLDKERNPAPATESANTQTASVDESAAASAEPWTRVSVGGAGLLSEIQVAPRRNGQKAEGLVLQSSRTSGLLEQSGLAPGDVLLAVNGTPVSDIAALAAIAGTLRDAERLSLEVERNGQRKVHRIAIDR